MKIRVAIFSVYVASSAVGFLFLMRFLMADVRPREEAAMGATLTDSARLLAALVPSPEVGAVAAWRERLAGVAPDLRVRVRTADGGLLVETSPANGTANERGLSKRAVGRLLSEAPTEETTYLQATAEVTRGGQVVAVVEVAKPRAVLDATIWEQRKRIAATGFSIAAVMLVAGWWIARRLTRSVERLTAHVEAMRDGKTAPPPTSRATEIRTLGRAFEAMRTALDGKVYIENYTRALAHECKTPLTAIRGAAELLDEPVPEEDRRRFVGNIRAEAGRLQHLVDGLLQLTSLEAFRGGADAAPVSVVALVEATVTALRPLADAGGVRLVVADVEPSWRVRGEARLLELALTNLVRNAVEFTPRDGEVVIAGGADAGAVTITILDTGTGIPAFARERVFERFYSLPRPGTGRKSTGLGLAIVREIVRVHAGTVALDNRPEGGAVARLALPRAV